MNNFAKKVLPFFIIILLGGLFHSRYINEFPSYTHAWAQSDRYALSLGFVKNGLNFFKPQTFVMNHKFPDDWKVPSTNSITAVDFPIHDYIPAVFMKISGTNSVYIFRLYILLYSFVGLFYLFKLAYLQTNDTGRSIFVLIFAATSPVFVFYQGGFLPTIPSLSNAIIGIYFYVKYLKQADKHNFRLTIAFLTLATLSRTTFGVILIAIFCLEILKVIRGENKLKDKMTPVVLSVLLIILYLAYNSYLRKIYGSIFLSDFRPAASFKEAKEIVKGVYNSWLTQYFSTFHYVLLFSVVIAVLFFALRKRAGVVDLTNGFWLLILTLFAGYFAFAVLMLQQFAVHDYYFLDTFFLPIILFLIAIISYIPKWNVKHYYVYSGFTITLLSIPLVISAINSQSNRRNTGYWDRTTATIENFIGSEAFLDSLKINPNARMLVIDAYAPNIPFILMNRKGYAIMSTTKENIQDALNWNYDYIIVQNDFFVSDIYVAYPEIISRIKKIADNGKISICTLLEKTESDPSLVRFLALEDKFPVFQRNMTFDTIPDPLWTNIQSTTKVFHSAPGAGYLTKDMPYGLTYKASNLKALTEKNRILLFSAYFQKDTLNDCEIVAFINSNGQNVYYKSYNLREILKAKNAWERADLIFNIPRIESENNEFGIYIWNREKSNLYVDDFEFKLY